MTQETQSQISTLVREQGQRLANLWARWQDEKAFEDFEEYAQVMQKMVEKHIPTARNFIARKRPFGILFDVESYQVFFLKQGQYVGTKKRSL